MLKFPEKWRKEFIHMIKALLRNIALVQTIKRFCVWQFLWIYWYPRYPRRWLLNAHGVPLLVAGARSKPINYSALGSPNESADTPYDPVGGPQGHQVAHGLPLLVTGADGGGARSQLIKYYAPGSPKKSTDTPYDPVGGPQGLKDAHGLLVLAPSAGGRVAR